MFSSYRRLFAVPGSAAFTLAGALARFPGGMTGIAAVFMITGSHRSYALAGALAATVLGVTALAGPQLSRLVDRRGQARTALPALFVATAGGLAELLCLRLHAPTWTLFAGAALTGLVPNFGSMSRARWAALHEGSEPLLHSAYALESVVDEAGYILGPIVATVLATTLFPAAGFVGALLLGLVGGLLFSAQRRTEPAVRPAAPGQRGTALRSPALLLMVLTLAATGGVFGIMEITTIGYAAAHHHKAAASLVLSCYALGSCGSGLVFGLWQPKGAPARRLLYCLLAMTVSLTPLPLVGGLPAVAVVLLVSGCTTAPTMVTSMALVRASTPAASLNEAFSWAVTGILVGVSLGAAAGGWAVDHLGAGAGYRVPTAAAGLALLTALLGHRRLRAATVPEPAVLPGQVPAVQ